MYCPQCGEPQKVGSQRCNNCGTPFTRREAKRGGGRSTQAPDPVPSKGGQQWERGIGVRPRLLRWLAGILLLVLVVVAAAALLWSTAIQSYLDRTAHTPTPAPTSPQPTQQPGFTLPSGVPNLIIPSGGEQVVVTQEDLNAKIAEQAGKLGPIDKATVEITPDGLSLKTTALGVTGTYHGQVEARNGQLVITNGKVDGPLGWVMPVDQIEATLNDTAKNALTASGATVTGVSLEQGKMVVSVEPK